MIFKQYREIRLSLYGRFVLPADNPSKESYSYVEWYSSPCQKFLSDNSILAENFPEKFLWTVLG